MLGRLVDLYALLVEIQVVIALFDVVSLQEFGQQYDIAVRA
jgi:hypothetical protein